MEIQRIGNQQPRFTGAFKLSVKNSLLGNKQNQRLENLTDLLNLSGISINQYNNKYETLPYKFKMTMTGIGNPNASKIKNAEPERKGFTTTTIIAGKKDLASFNLERIKLKVFLDASNKLLDKIFESKMMTESESLNLNQAITKIENESNKAIKDMNLKRFQISSESEIPTILKDLNKAIIEEENNPAQAINFEI